MVGFLGQCALYGGFGDPKVCSCPESSLLSTSTQIRVRPMAKHEWYPPVTNIAMENSHRNSGFSHQKPWFSIPSLSYQRVLKQMVVHQWSWKKSFSTSQRGPVCKGLMPFFLAKAIGVDFQGRNHTSIVGWVNPLGWWKLGCKTLILVCIGFNGLNMFEPTASLAKNDLFAQKKYVTDIFFG